MSNGHVCNIKEYDGKYRCMICFRQFTLADEEEAMNHTLVAPALARIQELEKENISLKEQIAAMKVLLLERLNGRETQKEEDK